MKSRIERLAEEEVRRELALQHEAVRGAYLRKRRGKRATYTLGQRVDVALAEAAILSSAPSSRYEPRSRKGKAKSSPPPQSASGAFLRGSESIGDAYGRRLALMVARLEDEIDLIKLRPIGHTERREDRLARLLGADYLGMSADEVAFIDPSLGTVLSIRRERQQAGLDTYGRKSSV